MIMTLDTEGVDYRSSFVSNNLIHLYFFLMNISPVTLKENRIHSNPAIFKLNSKLDLFINAKAEAKSPKVEVKIMFY